MQINHAGNDDNSNPGDLERTEEELRQVGQNPHNLVPQITNHNIPDDQGSLRCAVLELSLVLAAASHASILV